jgi:CheY-like chemotaxis protein
MTEHLNGRVLLVDDAPQIRKVISEGLVAAGYTVQTAVDGLDAIGKLRAELPDLIISDLSMPRMSGHELLAVVRKRFPQIPVIAISALDPDEIPAGVAADAYYRKGGFRFQQLLDTISDLTRKPPLRTRPRLTDDEPVQARWDGDGHYLIDCKDCLRVFSFPRTPGVVRDEKWTICVHCGNLVRFLVAALAESTSVHPAHPAIEDYPSAVRNHDR